MEQVVKVVGVENTTKIQKKKKIYYFCTLTVYTSFQLNSILIKIVFMK